MPAVDEEEYIELMGFFYEVVQSIKGKPVTDSRIVDIEKLAMKLFYHAGTAHMLRQSTKVPISQIEVGAQFYDSASTLVIARAAFETYLLFFHVFVDSNFPSDAFEFRHSVWRLMGLLWRQTLPTRDPEFIRGLLNESQQIKDLSDKIRSTTEFNSKSSKQQKRILEGRNWKPGWTALAVQAGFGPKSAGLIYSYLSDYAHSGSISGNQIREATTAEGQWVLMELPLDIIAICISKMIQDYSNLFDEAQRVFESNRKMKILVQALSEAANQMIEPYI